LGGAATADDSSAGLLGCGAGAASGVAASFFLPPPKNPIAA
jgi:hypothetical protein